MTSTNKDFLNELLQEENPDSSKYIPALVLWIFTIFLFTEWIYAYIIGDMRKSVDQLYLTLFIGSFVIIKTTPDATLCIIEFFQYLYKRFIEFLKFVKHKWSEF